MDNEPPNIQCPNDVEVTAIQGKCFGRPEWPDIEATDNCVTATVMCNYQSGDEFPIGTTTVVCRAIDAFGNEAGCEFDVTVNECNAGSNPTCGDPIILSCPAPITETANAGCGADIDIPEPIFGTDFFDCFDVTTTNDYTGTSNASGFYPVGVTVVTWTFIDEQDNTATCEQIITITDGIASTLDCPADIMLTANAGECTAAATWTPPTFNDNCPGGEITGSTHNPGQGNTIMCSFDVTVDECNDPPTVETISIIDDNDFNVGTNDTEDFLLNPVLTFPDPGTPANAVLSNITLELYFKIEPNSCENEIEVRLTDPVGNVNMFTPFATCNGSAGNLYFITLNVPNGQTTGSPANWIAEFRDTNDQNNELAEYSVRWGRLNYTAEVSACGVPVIVNCPTNSAVRILMYLFPSLAWTIWIVHLRLLRMITQAHPMLPGTIL